MKLPARIAEKLQLGAAEEVEDLVRRAIEEGLPTSTILNEGLIAGMNVVGERFRTHEIFLPEVLLAAKSMTKGLEVLEPLLVQDEVPSRGRVVLGTVEGDLHDIGKNLVGIMLQGAGFEVLDLGHDVAPDRVVETALREGASVIGLSALLTTTMPAMGRVMDLVRERKLGGRIKVIIGGAPVSAEFAREIGADAYGYDAANAVEKVRSLL